MSYSSDVTKNRILEFAKEEFLSIGFPKASMRKIAENAKVTTGAMYNHFKNKEELFDELVSDVANELCVLFKEQHESCEALKSYREENCFETMNACVYTIIDFIYDNFEEMKLIICCSQGTKYDDYMEKLIEVEEESTKKLLTKSNMNISEKDSFFIHVMSSSSMYNTFEAVKHDLSKQEAEYYMERINRFYYAGWNELLGSK